MKTVSTKKQKLLTFIRDYRAEHQFSPSFQEMMTACDLTSTSVVAYNLDKLEAHGLVIRPHQLPRTVTLTEKALANG